MILLALRKLWAFIKRDFLIESSYKLGFALDLIGSVFPVLTFFFVGKLIRVEDSPSLARYGGDYFSFALVGIAFTQYSMAALHTFAGTVRRAQTAGVLEAMLSTQTSPQAVILYTSGYSFLMATVHIVFVFALGGLVLDVNFAQANVPAALLTLALAIAAISALGILSATAIVVLKKGDPIEVLIGSVSSLLGGAFFPITVMPDWMQLAALALPITHALEAMRLALFSGATVLELWRELACLGGMALVLLPVSLLAFGRAVEKGRYDGSLMHY
ncbi:MAG: ABC transporter permease [bacterium]|nr:ABC transporter permease [bacterium]